MTNNNIWLLAPLAAALVLAGCGRGGIANRERPDEFAVGRQAPLVIPPDYTLTPPKPGAPRPLAADSQQQALEALFGPGVRLPPKSDIENRLLDDARATRPDPAIRNSAGDQPGKPATFSVDKGTFLRELLDAPAATRNPETARVSIGG
jgi:predicted small lipoprotein YifL